MNAVLQLSIICAASAIFAGCGTVTHSVDRPQLAKQLAADTEATASGGAGYQWSYIGSRDAAHYFRRQVMRFAYSELHDGFYALPKDQFDIGDEEFTRPSPDNSAQWKQAFTRQETNSLRQRYSIDYGIESWTPIQKRKIGEQVMAPNGP